MLPFLSRTFKPVVPKIIPAIIRPMIPGSLSFEKNNGIINITKRVIPKTVMGSLIGR